MNEIKFEQQTPEKLKQLIEQHYDSDYFLDDQPIALNAIAELVRRAKLYDENPQMVTAKTLLEFLKKNFHQSSSFSFYVVYEFLEGIIKGNPDRCFFFNSRP